MFPVDPDQHWTERIGYLFEPPHDHWWTITTEDDVPVVAGHVVTVVGEKVLPQLQARLTGKEPPPVPRIEAGPIGHCPAPTCTSHSAPNQDDLDNLQGDTLTRGDGVLGASADQRDLFDRARAVALPRTQAWKVLHISRARLDSYADRIGAGSTLTLAQLLALDLLGADDLLAPERWTEAVELVAAWLAQQPTADHDMALIAAEDSVAVRPLRAALTPDAALADVSVVHPLAAAARNLLQELADAGAL